MNKVLELIDLALSQIESDTTRTLLRGLINMLVEQATGSAKVASVDALIQENANMRSQLVEMEGRAQRALARQSALFKENGRFKEALDEKDKTIADLERQIVELRNAHTSLLEKEAWLRKDLREATQLNCSPSALRRSLAAWCLSWYFRMDPTGSTWSPLTLNEQARLLDLGKPLDGHARDATCAVQSLFQRLCKEAGL